MNPPRRIEIRSFTVAGPQIRTKNTNEMNANTAQIPKLWQNFYTHPLATTTAQYFGVYSDYESDDTGFYNLTAGIVAPESVPPGWSTMTIPSGTYLVFENWGPAPQTIIKTWQAVWTYFQNQSQVQRLYQVDFEKYNGPEQCAIYIGVKEG